MSVQLQSEMLQCLRIMEHKQTKLENKQKETVLLTTYLTLVSQSTFLVCTRHSFMLEHSGDSSLVKPHHFTSAPKKVVICGIKFCIFFSLWTDPGNRISVCQ